MDVIDSRLAREFSGLCEQVTYVLGEALGEVLLAAYVHGLREVTGGESQPALGVDYGLVDLLSVVLYPDPRLHDRVGVGSRGVGAESRLGWEG